jgi:hypothetical protein
MADETNSYTEECGCRRCSTSATFTEYDCRCVTVEIHDDDDPCDECSRFSSRREYCGQSGHPDSHE